ncbi:MAG: glutamyl-tRNA reductase [Desulfobacteraceae bacterium 4572_187]|nr:MAG: glutamyl-tRNA reductase [Desulfobacteraceae bacterium 4572_187]
MLEIVLLGLNHKTAPVALRECLAFSPDETSTVLRAFQESPVISEAVLVSTCNRVEILMATEDKANAVRAAKMFLTEFKKLPASEFEKSLYIHKGDDAVRHMFSGVILNKLFHRTFFVAKRVRSETGIGDHAVSVSYAAIELGRKIFGAFEGKKVLLIGAGEMAELAVEHLIRNKAGDILVANRTFENGVKLAKRFKGEAIRFEEIADSLPRVDIVISSTGSPDYVVTREQVKAIIRRRRNRPIFFIDIAVPRDIDPEINRLTNSYVYDIDDLKGVIDESIKNRNKEAIKGERIVDEAVIGFKQWYDNLHVVPTIVALRNKMDGIAKAEIKKTLNSLKHLSDDDRQAITRMTSAMINKILHDPTLLLKSNGYHQNKSGYLDITRKLFKLDE